MPLDVLGCTRATLTGATSFFVGAWCVGLVSSCCAFSCSGVELGTLLNTRRAGDRCLQLFILNEEFLVSAIHQIALITSLPFVHTARRYYRLNVLVRSSDCDYLPLLDGCHENLSKPYHLEEGEVVTRFP